MRDVLTTSYIDCEQCLTTIELRAASGSAPLPAGWVEVTSWKPNYSFQFCSDECVAAWFGREIGERHTAYRNRVAEGRRPVKERKDEDERTSEAAS